MKSVADRSKWIIGSKSLWIRSLNILLQDFTNENLMFFAINHIVEITWYDVIDT